MAEECLFSFPLSYISCHVSSIFFPPYFTLASLRDPVFPLIFFRHSAQLSECGPQEWAPKLQNTSPIVWEKHCRRAKKKKELNFVSLFPCVYLCVYLLGALYARPLSVFYTPVWAGVFSLCFFLFFLLLLKCATCFMWKRRPGWLLMLTKCDLIWKNRHISAPHWKAVACNLATTQVFAAV